MIQLLFESWRSGPVSATLAAAAIALSPFAVAQGSPRSDAVFIQGASVVFPDAPGVAVALAEREHAFLSPGGARALLFNADTLTARVFDRAGRAVTTFRADAPYACAAVSDGGSVALASPVAFPERRTQKIQIFSASGGEVRTTGESLVNREIEMQFSPDGSRLALLAPAKPAEPGAPPVLRALVLNAAGGELYHFDFDGDRHAAALAFSPDGKTLAFAAGAAPGGEASRIAIFRGEETAPRVVACGELGQPVDRRGLAFASDSRSLAVNGLACLMLIDTVTAEKRWTMRIDPAGERGLDTAAAVASVGAHIAAVHRVGAPEGKVRYAINIIDLQGGRVREEVVTAPQPRLADTGALLSVSADGKTVVVHTAAEAVEISVP